MVHTPGDARPLSSIVAARPARCAVAARGTRRRSSRAVDARSRPPGQRSRRSLGGLAPMLTRRLGRTDLDVSVLCFGGNVFGWTTDAAQSAAVLDAFMEAGGNFVDTADVYSRWVPGHQGGESEVILGQWMKDRGNRKDVIVATKLGSPMGEGKQGLSKKYMVQAVEESLQRLQTDYIDLYQSHRDDQETPLEEIMAAFDDLVKQGKVRWIGASNFAAERLAKANAVAKQGGWA